MTNVKKVSEAYQRIVENNLLENRSEYDSEDLQSEYELSQAEAKILYHLIQSKFYDVYRKVVKINAEQLSPEINAEYGLLEAIILFQLLGEALIPLLHCGETGEECVTCNVGVAHQIDVLDAAFNAGAKMKEA